MANASAIPGLFSFKAKHTPFMLGALGRSPTKTVEIMGRIKAKWSQEDEESVLEDQTSVC